MCMITYNGNGGMDTVAVGLNERGRRCASCPKGMSSSSGPMPDSTRRFCSIRPFTSSTACSDGRARTYFLIGLEGKPIRYSTYEDFRMARRLMAAA